MTQKEIFLVGYDEIELGDSAQKTAENAQQFFLDLCDVERIVDPIVLYSPDPAGEIIAQSVAEAFPDEVSTTLAASPRILEGGSHPPRIQRVDSWLGHDFARKFGGAQEWKASTTIVVTRAPLVHHLSNDPYEWLFRDAKALDDVVRCELIPPELPFSQLPAVGIALSGENLLKIDRDVPMLLREPSAAA